MIIPVIAYGLGRLFFADQPALALGLLLAALLPTSGMTISWTGFANGNVPAAIKITLIGLITGSVLTPFYVQGLLGANIPVQLGAVFKLLVPLFILYAINYVLSTVIARKVLNRGDGIALVYGTVMRNLSIALALSMTAFGEAGTQAALLIALAYIIQVQSAALYMKLSHRLFPC